MLSLRHVLVALPLAAALTTSAPAQVPTHWAVVGTASFPTALTGLPVNQTGTTGLFMVPLPTTANSGPQTVFPITGLPADCTVPASQLGGVANVLHRPADGLLIVCPLVMGAGSLSVHLIQLQGMAVASVRSVNLGTLVAGAALGAQAAWLPDGRVLLATGTRAVFLPGSGASSVSELSILDLSAQPPSVTPVPLPAIPGQLVWAPQVSADGRTAWFMTENGMNTQYQLWSVGIDPSSPGYGTPVLRLTFPRTFGASMLQPELTDDGILHVTGVDYAVPGTIRYRVDTTTLPVTVTTRALGTASVVAIGPTMDPANGASIYASIDAWSGLGGTFANSLVMESAPGAPLVPFAQEPSGGWCFPYAIEVHSSFQTYGDGTPAANDYRIVTPNPGGLPEISNASFSVSVQSSGSAPGLGLLAIGFAEQSTTILGLQALVVPQVSGVMMGGTQMQLAQPIPNVASLAGLDLYAQAVLFENGAIASSDAVHYHILN